MQRLRVSSAVSLLLLAAAAAAQEGVPINITNDSTDNVLVTIYNTSLGPHAAVLSAARLNGFATLRITVAPDSTGRVNLSWTAVTAQGGPRRCGHAEHVGLGDGDAVVVHADSDCNAVAKDAPP